MNADHRRAAARRAHHVIAITEDPENRWASGGAASPRPELAIGWPQQVWAWG